MENVTAGLKRTDQTIVESNVEDILYRRDSVLNAVDGEDQVRQRSHSVAVHDIHLIPDIVESSRYPSNHLDGAVGSTDPRSASVGDGLGENASNWKRHRIQVTAVVYLLRLLQRVWAEREAVDGELPVCQ